MLLNTLLLLSGGDFFSRWLEGWNLGGLILVLIGAALIIIEMLIPGFGIAGISVNYPIYKKLLAKGKNKYASDIIRLAGEIADEQD